MESFRWDKHFITGLSDVDDQHHKLVDLINRFGTIVSESGSALSDATDSVLEELAAYTEYHFTEEEKMMAEVGVDTRHVDAQHKAHTAFLTEVSTMRCGLTAHDVKQAENLLKFLTHWLAYHILESDMRTAKVVLAIQSGLSLEQAEKRADLEMSGAMKVLIEAVLSMYDAISTRTMQLMKEIQARKKAEVKLRLASNAIENSQEAICITDADANIIEANPAFYEITQSTHDDVVGRSLKTFKTAFEEDEALSSTIWRGLAEHGHWSGEIWSRANNGEIDAEWLTLSSIKNDQGEVSNYVGVFSNIADLIQQRNKLQHTASMIR